ncbi:aldehyde dehydrogenase family protein [Flavobacterium piscinae]|uniref:aldehyde dehydrogenase family protein n=1 Tax=Flavobacterium piscinae TaxID=2506424 RepID=UPI002AAA8BA1|nr:aldehyde dehydrogenase family protein [Flavobacterium piscinae]
MPPFFAGNTVVLKPSELTFNTSQIVTKIVEEVFDVKEAVVVHGGAEFTQSLLEKRWDYIFLPVVFRWVKLWHKRYRKKFNAGYLGIRRKKSVYH